MDESMPDLEESKIEAQQPEPDPGAGQAAAAQSGAAPAGPTALTTEEKRKVWTKRIVGLIVIFAVLGCVTLLVAVQLVTNMFKMILSP